MHGSDVSRLVKFISRVDQGLLCNSTRPYAKVDDPNAATLRQASLCSDNPTYTLASDVSSHSNTGSCQLNVVVVKYRARL